MKVKYSIFLNSFLLVHWLPPEDEKIISKRLILFYVSLLGCGEVNTVLNKPYVETG
jgi:hypothetical protein